MIELDINKALDKLVEDYAKANNIPVAWDNEEFEPGQQAYLKPSFLPASTLSPTIQNIGQIYRGVYQVSLIAPIGSGSQAHRRTASAIAVYMLGKLLPNATDGVTGVPVGSDGHEVYVTGPATISAGFNDGYGYNIPITLNYRADT